MNPSKYFPIFFTFFYYCGLTFVGLNPLKQFRFFDFGILFDVIIVTLYLNFLIKRSPKYRSIFYSIALIPPFLAFFSPLFKTVAPALSWIGAIVMTFVSGRPEKDSDISPTEKTSLQRTSPFMWVATICFGIFNYFAFFPAVISPDTEYQIQQGIHWQFNDVHPPLLAILLGLFHRLGGAAEWMMFLNIAMLWAGIGTLAVTALKLTQKVRNGCLVFLIGLCPAILNYSGIVWKDTPLAVSWFLAVSLILESILLKTKMNLIKICFIFVLLIYGTAMRFNSITGLIPILALLLFALKKPWYTSRPSLKKLFVSIGMLALLIILPVNSFNSAIIQERTYIQQWLYLYDLAGISVRINSDEFIPTFQKSNPYFSMDHLKSEYHVSDAGSLCFSPPSAPFRLTKDPLDLNELQSKWFLGITHHPLAYLQHRLNYALYFLNIIPDPVNMEVYFGVMTHDYYNRFNFRKNPAANLTFQYLTFFKQHTPLIKNYFWFLILILLFASSVKKMLRKGASDLIIVIALISASGILYSAPFFLIGATAEFRYNYWMVFTSCIAIVLTLLSRAQSNRLDRL